MEPWGLRPKKFHTDVAVPPTPVRVPTQRPFAPSVASEANDKSDNEIIPGPVHRYPGICLTAKENPRKPQLEDRLMKVLCLKWSPMYSHIDLGF